MKPIRKIKKILKRMLGKKEPPTCPVADAEAYAYPNLQGNQITCDQSLALKENTIFLCQKNEILREIPLDILTAVSFVKGVGCCEIRLEFDDGTIEIVSRGNGSKIKELADFSETCQHKIKNKNKSCSNFVEPRHKEKTKITSAVFRFLKLAKPEYPLLALVILLYFLSTLVGLVTPYINRILVDDYINSENPGMTSAFLWGFVGMVASYFALMVARRLVNILRLVITAHVEERLIVRLRKMVFEKIQRLSLQRTSEISSGELMKRVMHDCHVLRQLLVTHLPNLVEAVMMVLVFSVFMFFIDWRLSLIVLLPTFGVAIILRVSRRKMRKLQHKNREMSGQSDSVLHDTFSGIRVVKAYGTEKTEEKKFVTMADKLRRAEIRSGTFFGWLNPLLSFLTSFGEYAILYYVGGKMLQGLMTAGELSQFSSYSSMIFAPLGTLMRLPQQFSHGAVSLGRIYEIVDEPETLANGEKTPEIRDGRIDVNHISFGYRPGEEVLQDVDLHIQPGEFIGLVGRSGVGKSTLINLLLRLYDVTDGSITVDGIDLREYDKATLRRQMGVVLQENFLFAGSVWQNLVYAKPNATREEVISSAKMAGAHEFIVSLPEGYETYIGEKGYTLSGGERQRIAIARAILHDPKILILDEATASLDTETETLVQEALQHLCRNRTTIAIAHRLSTLRNATKLVVLDKGRVAEIGTHAELMAKHGIYYGLVMAQREMNQIDEKLEENIETHIGETQNENQ